MNPRGLILPAIALVLWEVAVRSAAYQSDMVAAPSQIAVRGIVEIGNGTMLLSFGETFASALMGLAAGGGLGIIFGLLTGSSRLLESATFAPVELLRPIPSVALIPSLLLLLGFGYRFEVAIVGFACFWPMSIITHAAVRTMEPRLSEVARVLRFGAVARTVKIYLPAILPRLFVAIRLTLGLALIVAVTVEIAANPQGIGYLLIQAQQSLQPDLLFAALFILGAAGWAINEGLLWTQARLFPGRDR